MADPEQFYDKSIPEWLEPDLHTTVAQSVTDLGSRGSPILAERVIAKAAHHAYHLGRHEALRELLTTQMVAAMIGVTEAYVRRKARELGVGWNIGRDWLFRPEDVETLRNRPDRRRKVAL